ncbi:MAG: eukaryotic-like serine/threonine-protein kinase [Thermoplasmata archaeon]|jgi:hypothetical protein|nr:eukaryotic-like serine/threonine-protein kinase [Thermoplasmata archaeon]
MVDAVALASSADALLGAFLLLFALALARLSADRTVRTLLALFVALVGVNYLVDGTRAILNLAGVVDPGIWRIATFATHADPPVLLAFALAATRKVLPRGVVPGLLAYAAVSSWVFSFHGTPQTGPLFVAEIVLAYGGSFALLAADYLRAQDDLDARGSLVVAFALACLPRIALTYLDLGLVHGAGGRAQAQTLVMEALLAAAFAAFFVATRLARPPAKAHVARTTLAIGALLLVVELTWLLRFVPGVAYVAFGFAYSARWFLVLAVVAAALPRHELLGVPTSVAGPLRVALLAVVVAVAATLTAGLLGGLLDVDLLHALVGGAAVAGLGTLGVVAVRLALPRAEGDLAWRRASVLRSRALLGATDAELEDLRVRLGLTPVEARRVLELARLEGGVPPSAPRMEEGAVVAGRYVVHRALGAGTFGRAFEATDRADGARVVLKELRPEWSADAAALRAFRREAEVALSLSHPNVVGFRAVEPTPEGHLLVLDHVEGETLAARLARGPMGEEDARRLARGLLSGLGALHERGILHRDVKPANVVMAPRGRVVLLDMGAASARDATRPAGAHPGSPAYMSPEQARGEPLTPASDLHAAASVIWEAIAGDLPPRGAIPPRWREALLPALAADPARRPQSAAALLARIDSA